MIQREHILQKHIKLWVRDCVDEPHEFFAFDRGKASGQFTHMLQRARGVRAGTPDTMLCIKISGPIWYECKDPGHKPTELQMDVGARLQKLCHDWSWGSSVVHYSNYVKECGVKLRPNAEFLAQHHDAQVLSTIAKAEAKPAKAPRAAPKVRYGRRAA